MLERGRLPDFIETFAGVFFPGVIIAEHDLDEIVIFPGYPADKESKHRPVSGHCPGHYVYWRLC